LIGAAVVGVEVLGAAVGALLGANVSPGTVGFLLGADVGCVGWAEG
jgi:hypothetical protein